MAEGKFGKSRRNQGTERLAIRLLEAEGRLQKPDRAAKKRILELLDVTGDWSGQTFDAIVVPQKCKPITAENAEEHLADIRLVEVKSTKKPIADEALNGFFFGSTKRQYDLAAALGDRYVYAFAVLNSNNRFGAPFVVLLSPAEVARRTRARRVQYQVNFRTDIVVPDDAEPPYALPGSLDDPELPAAVAKAITLDALENPE